MNTEVEDVLAALREIPDPEMPIGIVDLGIVERVHIESENGRRIARITLLPTFVGCPALDMIRDQVTECVRAMEGIDDAEVAFVFDPPWSIDRISDAGRDSLAAHGVTVPAAGGPVAVTLSTSAVPCPFCASNATRLDSPFGPTRCRAIHYCEACKNTFEQMKRV